MRLNCQLVTTPEEARHAVWELTQFSGKVLFQEFLSGRQESVSIFYDRDDVYTRFAQWTRRAHPPLGGVSTYRQSIALPEDTTEQAERLIRAIDLEGYAPELWRNLSPASSFRPAMTTLIGKTRDPPGPRPAKCSTTCGTGCADATNRFLQGGEGGEKARATVERD